MRRTDLLRALACLLPLLVAPLSAAQESATAARAEVAQDTLTEAEALAAFDEAWQTIKDTHFDVDFNGVDWDALRDELRPKAAAARDRHALREVLSDMLGRLGQSHFGVIPSDVLPQSGAHDESGGPGLDVRLVEGDLAVVSVVPGSAADEAGVRPGWLVRELGGMDVDRRIERLRDAGLDTRKQAFTMWQTARASLLGAVGGSVDLVLEDAAGETVELALERRARDVTAQDVGASMPTFFMEFASRDIEREGRHYGYIAFSNWFFSVVKPINDAVERMRRADGVIIDLRGNTGGVAAMTMGTAGHFVSKRETLGKMLMRDSQLNFQITPQTVNTAGEEVEPFSGPLAILVDETTGSASEVFAGGLQSLGRARVFGATSAGAVLPAMPTRLPNGDTMLHALGDFETSTGVRLEGVGVVPDVPVARTRAGLLAGRDEQLEAALDWLDRQAADKEQEEH